MGQTNYLLAPLPGVPGKIYDLNGLKSGDIISCLAGKLIPFGVLCELDANGLLQPIADINANWPPSGAAAGTSLAGISVWDPEGVMQDYLGPAPVVPPTGAGSSTQGWPKGARVPVMRKGRIWMAYDGVGTPTRLGPFNVWHSSTTGLQGVATFTAPATTAGAEVSVVPPSLEVFNPDGQNVGTFTDSFGNTVGVIAVSVSLPGYGS